MPVIALFGGRRVVVGNSNRFGASQEQAASLTVVDGKTMKVHGTLQGGEFPREMRLSPDGRTLYLTNLNSGTLQMFDVREIRRARDK